jgi:hypothetical protein
MVEVLPFKGPIDATSPSGKPDTDNWTFPEKPFSGTIAIDACPPAHWFTLRLDGETFSVKLPGPAVVVVIVVVVAVGAVPEIKEHDEDSKRKLAMPAINKNL